MSTEVHVIRVSSLARTIFVAATILGLVEVALYRVAGPVLSHLPSGTVDGGIVRAVVAAGEHAFRGTAALVAAGAVAYLATTRWHGRVAPFLVATCLAATAVATVIDASAARVAAHLTLVVAVAGLAGAALAERRRIYALGVLAAALSLLAGRLPLLLDGLASGREADVGLTVSALTLAEAAFVAAPALLAVELVRRRRPPALAWATAAAVSLVTAAALVSSPSYTAITATWATGVTLSLPVPLYIMSAGAAALVVATWLTRPRAPLLVAGFVLFVVAGTQPAVVHHNLTAVLALMLLATPVDRHEASPVVNTSMLRAPATAALGARE